jgi:hypothetical protein
MEAGALILLGTLFIMREWMNWRDRRDLMDRLMCRDFQEYKRAAFRRSGPADGKNVNMTDEEMAEEERRRSEV